MCLIKYLFCLLSIFISCRLRPETLQLSSPLLQQLFFFTIFIQTDIHIQEGALFCDSLCDGGPLIWGQVSEQSELDEISFMVGYKLYLSTAHDNTAQSFLSNSSL